MPGGKRCKIHQRRLEHSTTSERYSTNIPIRIATTNAHLLKLTYASMVFSLAISSCRSTASASLLSLVSAACPKKCAFGEDGVHSLELLSLQERSSERGHQHFGARDERQTYLDSDGLMVGSCICWCCSRAFCTTISSSGVDGIVGLSWSRTYSDSLAMSVR